MRAFKRSFAVSARYDKRCVVCVFAMDAVAAAALVAENAALHDEFEDVVVYDGRGVIRKLMTANDALCKQVQDMAQHFYDSLDINDAMIQHFDTLRQQRQDSFDLNDALIQQRDTLRQHRKELKANLRWQAFVNSELHKEVAVLSLSVARLRNARLKSYVLATRQHRRTKRRVYK